MKVAFENETWMLAGRTTDGSYLGMVVAPRWFRQWSTASCTEAKRRLFVIFSEKKSPCSNCSTTEAAKKRVWVNYHHHKMQHNTPAAAVFTYLDNQPCRHLHQSHWSPGKSVDIINLWYFSNLYQNGSSGSILLWQAMNLLQKILNTGIQKVCCSVSIFDIAI